jgi:hypothetical protein
MLRHRVLSPSLLRCLLRLFLAFNGILAFGVPSGLAQSYFDFTFTNNLTGTNLLSVNAIVTATGASGNYTITNITGTETSGSNQYAILFSSTATFRSPDELLFYPTAPFLDAHGIDYESNGVTYNVFTNGLPSSPRATLIDSAGDVYANNALYNFGPVPTPGPIPGSGLLSFVAFGLAGLFYWVKLICSKISRRGLLLGVIAR